MNSKHCPHCNCSTGIVKIGTTSAGRQRYRCKKCNRTWVSKPHAQVLAKSIWNDLVFRNMNYNELANKYKMSERNIRRKLDLYTAPNVIPTPADVIAMDVTYFGRSWGILTVINIHNGKTLYCEPTSGYETVWDYERAIKYLRKHGVYPKVAVIDGKKGVINMLEEYGIKVQFCQFHQLKIITQCLTRKPVLLPNIELRNIALTLAHIDKKSFVSMVYGWKLRNEIWLQERSRTEDGKWEYTHRLTRRAINSLIMNLPYLFTYQESLELNIPNTNNQIEGLHSELKRRLNNHRGLKKNQKIQFARIFFSGRTEV